MDGSALLSTVDEDQPKPKAKNIGLCHLTLVLTYYMVLSFLQNGLTALVIPAELAIFSPNKTALINGLLIGLGAVINIFSPIIGHQIDSIGQRPLLVLGAFLVSGGEAMLILGVYLRPRPGDAGFTFYFGGYLVTQVGCVILSTCFNALVANLSALNPENTGKISAIYGIYGLAGATISYVCAGVLFPISKHNHDFYWVAICLTILSNIALLMSLPSLSFIKTLVVKDPEEVKHAPGIKRCLEVGTEWFCTDAYLPWRRVVLSRTLYFFGGGVFASSVLYFLYDCTDAQDPLAAMSELAVLSLSGSIIAAAPAGWMSDRYGPLSCVFVSGIGMGLFFGLVPSSTSLTPIYILIPLYGIAQQLYNVADLAMIVTVLPNPTKVARDMGGWSSIEYVGQALGNVLAGVILTLDGKSHETVSESRDDDDFVDDEAGKRIRYTRFGYSTVFYPAAFCVILGSLILYPIRDKLQPKVPSEKEVEDDIQEPSLAESESSWALTNEKFVDGDQI